MNRERFNELMQEVFEKIREKERKKQKEYVPAEEDDRLAHFKEVGAITGEPAHQALRGMMVKHTKSIYDMLKAIDTITYDLHIWDEKLVDHIIYLILLRGLIQERYEDNVKDISRYADKDPVFNFEPRAPGTHGRAPDPKETAERISATFSANRD